MTLICVEPASRAFSMSSLRAEAGRCMILKKSVEVNVMEYEQSDWADLASGYSIDECLIEPANREWTLRWRGCRAGHWGVVVRREAKVGLFVCSVTT